MLADIEKKIYRVLAFRKREISFLLGQKSREVRTWAFFSCDVKARTCSHEKNKQTEQGIY